jgi:hypothetical protein
MKSKPNSKKRPDRPKQEKSEEELRAERNKRLEELFAEIDRGPVRRIGRLNREELYGR